MADWRDTIIRGVKHAFAVSPQDEADGEHSDLPAALERLAQLVVDRGLEAPALIFLETVRPLNFLGAQAGQAFMPLIRMLGVEGLDEAIAALEDRRTLRRLIDRIEELAACR